MARQEEQRQAPERFEEVQVRNVNLILEVFDLEFLHDEFYDLLGTVEDLTELLNDFLSDRDANLAAHPAFPRQLRQYITILTNRDSYRDIKATVDGFSGKGGKFIRANRLYEQMMSGPLERLIREAEDLILLAQDQDRDVDDEETAEHGFKVAFSKEKPEHPDKETWGRFYKGELDRLLNLAREQNNPEAAEQVLNMFLEHADYLVVDYLRSNSSMKSEIIGLMGMFIPYLRTEANDRPATENNVHRNFEALLDALIGEGKGEYWRNRFGSKALEMLSASYFDDLGRVKGHEQSMSSDWEKLWELDKEDSDFSIRNFDFMMEPDAEVGETFMYDGSRVMRVMLFLLPDLVKDFEDTSILPGWKEADGGLSREKFDEFLKIFLEFLLKLSQVKLAEAQVAEDELDTNEEVQQARNNLNQYIQSIGDSKVKKYLGGDLGTYSDADGFVARYSTRLDQGEFVSISADGKVRYQIQREEDYFSMGENEFVEVTEESIKTLVNDPLNHRRQILWRLAGRMGTALGVRQHTFVNDYARGSTPAAGIALHQRFMGIVSPLAWANYKSYKSLTPNPFAAHFTFEWDVGGIGDPTKNIMGSAEKARTIAASHIFTKTVLKQGAPLREYPIVAGSLNQRRDQLETAFPDPYTLVIGAARRRNSVASVGFESWDTGLKMFEKFIDTVKGVPGGTSNIEEIKKKDKKALRTELIKSLESLIQNTFSPLKASMEWFRWEHVAQFILMYIDKIFRVYRICDESEQGVVKLADGLRKVLESSSVNMAKMGMTKFKKQADGRYKLIEVGLVPERMKKVKGVDLYSALPEDADGNVYVDEATYQRLLDAEKKYCDIDLAEYKPLKGLRLPEAQMPRVTASGAGKNRFPDIRDYLLARIPKTHYMGALGVGIYVANDAKLDGKIPVEIMRYHPEFGIPQLILRRKDAAMMKLIEIQNREQSKVLNPKVLKAILGLPPEDKK